MPALTSSGRTDDLPRPLAAHPLDFLVGERMGGGVLQRGRRSALSAVAANPLQFAQAAEKLGLLRVVGDDGEDADGGIGRGEMFRREEAPVLLERLDGRLRRDEVGVRVGESEARCVGGAVEARAEHPHLRSRWRRRRRLEIAESLGERLAAVHERDQVLDLGRVVFDAERIAVGERGGRQAVAARRAANAQVDATRVEDLEQAEVLCDLERRIVGQHDAAGADAHVVRFGGQARDQDLRRRTGQRIGCVVLGNPVAVITELFATLRERRGMGNGIRRIFAAADG